MILVSASSSCFSLAVSMHEASCVGYTPRAWDPRSLRSILDGISRRITLNGRKRCFRSTVWFDHRNNNNNSIIVQPAKFLIDFVLRANDVVTGVKAAIVKEVAER